MRTVFGLVILAWTQVAAAAGTFVGQTTANFRVREAIDGNITTADKSGDLSISLTTDYSTMQWSVDFDVDLLIAGGPGQSFETRLLAAGSLTTSRCAGRCIINELDDPSPLSFPDATGTSGAGSYLAFGSASWTLQDRIEISSIVVDEGFCQAATSWDLTPSMN
jgi:hypothetical protein